MSEGWITSIKPSFQTEWLALPPKEISQILEKINLLTQDPTPDAKVKKQLKHMGGKLHRLRSGHYRIFYTFESPYISLLALRRRDDDTYDEDFDVEFLGGLDPDLSSTPAGPNWEQIFAPQEPPKTKLPEPITAELLTNLRIPEACHTRLMQVESREDLFECPGVPDEYILKLDEYLYEKPLVEVIQQPDLLTGDIDNLLRFKEGDLLGFLLRLDPEQEKFVTWALDSGGPTLLKGGPGTGKSTVALYRTREILRTLQNAGLSQPRILFTTYTNALIAFSEQLLQQLLGEDAQFIEVVTADKVAHDILSQIPRSTRPTDNAKLRPVLKQLLPQAISSLEGGLLQRQAQAQILERLSLDYLLEEFGSVIQARALTTLEDYQKSSRTGRAIPLNKIQRKAVWHLYQLFIQELAEKNLETWPQFRSRALEALQELPDYPRYDAVIIDETQDLAPNSLRLLTQLCKAPNRLFITADANQSIYGSSFRWADVHADLKFAGRTGILKKNYRNTREISEAAHTYLDNGILDDEAVTREYIHTGPPPAVRAVASPDEEGRILTRFCKTAAREFRLGIGSCAILTPTEKAGRSLAEQLSFLGMDAHFMTSRDLDLKRQGVKVLTLKAAKGLEFPIVALAGFLEEPYPYIPKNSTENAITEILNRERRTLFVAMTRAMRALLLLIPATDPGPLLQSFESTHWNLGPSNP